MGAKLVDALARSLHPLAHHGRLVWHVWGVRIVVPRKVKRRVVVGGVLRVVRFVVDVRPGADFVCVLKRARRHVGEQNCWGQTDIAQVC